MKNIKNVIFIILLNLICYSCIDKRAKINKNEFKNDLIELKFKGEVKSLIQTTYKAYDKFDETMKGDTIYKSTTYFNKSGNITEQTSFNFENNVFQKVKNKYDHNGFTIESNVFSINDKLVCKFIYKNDSIGNIIEDKFYSYTGDFGGKILYFYDSNNDIIETDSYDSTGNIKEKKTCKYDDYFNKIKENTTDSQGKLVEEIFYKYDENNNLIESKTSYYDNFGLNTSSTYKTDKMGNQIEEILHLPPFGETKYTFKYIYDENGNWINKIKLINGIPNETTDLKIVYY